MYTTVDYTHIHTTYTYYTAVKYALQMYVCVYVCVLQTMFMYKFRHDPKPTLNYSTSDVMLHDICCQVTRLVTSCYIMCVAKLQY